MKVMNGFFPHKNIHKYTWVQSTKQLKSIIDYFIQQQNSRIKTNDVRTYRGAECGSDHFLLVSKVIINDRRDNLVKGNVEEMNSESKEENKKCNINSLQHESTQFLYKIRLMNKLQQIRNEERSVEEKYEPKVVVKRNKTSGKM